MNGLVNQPRNDEGLRELALFAGAGGGILGGHLLGWKTICAVEYNAYTRSVLLARQNDGTLSPFPIWDDVRTFDGRLWNGLADVVSGGFPCQGVSVAGKGAGLEDERSGLWSEQRRIIDEVRPYFAWVENGPALTSRGLGTILGDLAALGFDAKWGVLSGRDFGAVHLRERIWILGTNNRKERGERSQSKTIPRFAPFPWGKNVRSLEELRERSDLPEPIIRRINHDVAFGVDRLAAIGNGQVSRVAAAAWRILSE